MFGVEHFLQFPQTRAQLLRAAFPFAFRTAGRPIRINLREADRFSRRHHRNSPRRRTPPHDGAQFHLALGSGRGRGAGGESAQEDTILDWRDDATQACASFDLPRGLTLAFPSRSVIHPLLKMTTTSFSPRRSFRRIFFAVLCATVPLCSLAFAQSPTPAPAPGRNLTVVTKRVTPFVMEKNGHLTGYSIELWERAVREARLPFDPDTGYKIVERPCHSCWKS